LGGGGASVDPKWEPRPKKNTSDIGKQRGHRKYFLGMPHGGRVFPKQRLDNRWGIHSGCGAMLVRREDGRGEGKIQWEGEPMRRPVGTVGIRNAHGKKVGPPPREQTATWKIQP